MLFKSAIYFFFFGLDDLSIVKSELLMSPTIIVSLSVSPFSSININFNLGVLMLGAYIFKTVICLEELMSLSL